MSGASEQIENIMLFRMSVLIPFAVIYIVSVWKNLYFRTVTVVSLIIVSSILWSDMELHLGFILVGGDCLGLGGIGQYGSPVPVAVDSQLHRCAPLRAFGNAK